MEKEITRQFRHQLGITIETTIVHVYNHITIAKKCLLLFCFKFHDKIDDKTDKDCIIKRKNDEWQGHDCIISHLNIKRAWFSLKRPPETTRTTIVNSSYFY